jgi:hypothetical protein
MMVRSLLLIRCTSLKFKNTLLGTVDRCHACCLNQMLYYIYFWLLSVRFVWKRTNLYTFSYKFCFKHMLLSVSSFKTKTNLSSHDVLSLPQRIHMVEHTRVGSKMHLLLLPLNMWSRCTLRLRQHMAIVLHSRRHRHHQRC